MALSRKAFLFEMRYPLVTFVTLLFCTFGALIYYKDNTRHAYIAEQERVLEALQARQYAIATERVEAIRQERIASVERRRQERRAAAEAAAAERLAKAQAEAAAMTLSQYEDALEEIIQQLREKEEEMNQVVTNVVQKRTQAQEVSQRIKSETMPDWDSITSIEGDPDLTNLERLLSNPKLSDMTDEDIDSLFESAIEELRILSEKKYVLNFDAAAPILTADYGTKERIEAAEMMTCPEIQEEKQKVVKKVPKIPSNAAKHVDMSQRVKKIEILMSRRKIADNSLSSLFLPDSVTAVTKASEKLLDKALNDIIDLSKKPVKEEKTRTSCVNEDQVMELLDEGLLALLRKSNVRNVLRRKAVELDPTATEIILDADLPPVQPIIRQRDTINLRRVVDTPLLARAAEWIDQLVEMCGGYNDRLDSYLDSFGRGRESVGEIVVRRILNESGRVELPHPKMVAKNLPAPLKSLLTTSSSK